MLTKPSKIRDMVHAQGLNVSLVCYEVIDRLVISIIRQACKEANKELSKNTELPRILKTHHFQAVEKKLGGAGER